MDVVGHQAIPEHAHAVLKALFPQQIEIVDPVVIDEENVLHVVAPLGNVVRKAGYYNAHVSGMRGRTELE